MINHQVAHKEFSDSEDTGRTNMTWGFQPHRDLDLNDSNQLFSALHSRLTEVAAPTSIPCLAAKRFSCSGDFLRGILHTLLPQWEFLPWEIRVAFPKESQLQKSRATQPLDIVRTRETDGQGDFHISPALNPNFVTGDSGVGGE